MQLEPLKQPKKIRTKQCQQKEIPKRFSWGKKPKLPEEGAREPPVHP